MRNGPILIVIALFLVMLLWHHKEKVKVRSGALLDKTANLFEQTRDSWLDNDAGDLSEDYSLSRQHFERTSPERIKLMKGVLKGTSRKSWFWADLYNGMVPEVFCPALVRVGKVGDGGKWICRPWAFPNDCAIYSLGVNQDTSFERELQDITGFRCRLYAFDRNDPGSPKVLAGFDKINAVFQRGRVGIIDDPANEEISVPAQMKKHNDQRMEILKIDIEGAEFAVLPELINHTKICQILVEIHGSPQQVLDLMNKLARGGYRLFSYEINGLIHRLSEYSFIHDDCLEQYNALPFAYYLDKIHEE